MLFVRASTILLGRFCCGFPHLSAGSDVRLGAWHGGRAVGRSCRTRQQERAFHPEDLSPGELTYTGGPALVRYPLVRGAQFNAVTIACHDFAHPYGGLLLYCAIPG